MSAKKQLTENEIIHYFGFLTEEITNFDCGSLCKPENDGIPFCCVTDNAVPLLYSSEFKFLSKSTDMWSRWKPVTKDDRKLQKDTESKESIFCQCKGIAKCERDFRSISCRTFPLEPYIDRRGIFVGLVFMKEFRHGCPLSKKPREIRQEFVDQHFSFWEKLLLRKENERETYTDSSKDLRRDAKKTKKKFPVLLPSYMKIKDIADYLY